MKLFVDANIYLDFYRIPAVKPLLKPLLATSDKLLVTSQVVSEVFRNKVDVANTYLSMLLTASSEWTLPDVLAERALTDVEPETKERLTKLMTYAKEVRDLLKDVFGKTLMQVAADEDKVSQELAKLFGQALAPTQSQIEAAGRRKTFGNPPGKKADPIGDEISWEQVLDFAQAKGCAMWIVSKDKDSVLRGVNKVSVGNAYLVREVRERGLPEFRFFTNLAEALKEFKLLVAKEIELPTDEELSSAAEAQEAADITDERRRCDHHVSVVAHQGVFDIWKCAKCGIEYRSYSDEICG